MHSHLFFPAFSLRRSPVRLGGHDPSCLDATRLPRSPGLPSMFPSVHNTPPRPSHAYIRSSPLIAHAESLSKALTEPRTSSRLSAPLLRQQTTRSYFPLAACARGPLRSSLPLLELAGDKAEAELCRRRRRETSLSRLRPRHLPQSVHSESLIILHRLADAVTPAFGRNRRRLLHRGHIFIVSTSPGFLA